MVATFLGTMGLPHVLVRFYTNPDGRAARRTALAVIALLSLFYLFPTLIGVFSRLYVPQLLITGNSDAAVLLAPAAAIGGPVGQVVAALVAAGAIAAFLATSSGLLVSFAGALATDVLPGRVRDFRLAAVVGGLIPIPLALTTAGGLESRRPPTQATLASVRWHGLGAVQRPPALAAVQRRFSSLPRRAEAQPTPPLQPQGSTYPWGWFDRAQPWHPPPHHHIAPPPNSPSLSLALPETLPPIEPEPPTSEETRCR